MTKSADLRTEPPSLVRVELDDCTIWGAVSGVHGALVTVSAVAKLGREPGATLFTPTHWSSHRGIQLAACVPWDGRTSALPQVRRREPKRSAA